MRMFVVLDNVMGSVPRIFSTLEKAKQFCYRQKECFLKITSKAFETTDEECENLFIIQSVWVDDCSDYDWDD